MEDKPLKTKDFYIIAMLKYHGIPILDITESGRIKTIHVDRTPEVKQLLLDYENGNIKVDIRTFIHAIEETKELVHR